MHRYVALLRAINVGGHVVKMTHLRELFEQMGFDNVETFIASGNVLFDSPSSEEGSLANRIESELERDLGYPVGTFIRNPREMRAVSQFHKIPGEDWKVYVAFLKQPLTGEMEAKVVSLQTDSERLAVNGREVYWVFKVPYSESKIAPTLGKLIGSISTSRNITTVRKIADKLAK